MTGRGEAGASGVHPAERDAPAHVHRTRQEVISPGFETQRLYGRRQQQAVGILGVLVWALSGLYG